MSAADELRDHLTATRSQLKALRNVATTTLHMVAELERRITDIAGEPEEADRNGSNRVPAVR